MDGPADASGHVWLTVGPGADAVGDGAGAAAFGAHAETVASATTELKTVMRRKDIAVKKRLHEFYLALRLISTPDSEASRQRIVTRITRCAQRLRAVPVDRI